MTNGVRDKLEDEHHPQAIKKRLDAKRRHSHLGDAVLGGIDGAVTTFAVVAGAMGARFSALVVIVLGFANLIADGFSMAVSNYQAMKTQRQSVDQARRREERHVREIPEGEREEIRQIFARKGFAGDVLDQVVAVITERQGVWVDTMLKEELGMQPEGPSPWRAGFATFAAFVTVGLLPLAPFLVPGVGQQQAFTASIGITAAAFFAIGLAKGRVLEQPLLRSGLDTLLTGGAAAIMAYAAAAWLRQAFGV